jgi:hypothetical protein
LKKNKTKKDDEYCNYLQIIITTRRRRKTSAEESKNEKKAIKKKGIRKQTKPNKRVCGYWGCLSYQTSSRKYLIQYLPLKLFKKRKLE